MGAAIEAGLLFGAAIQRCYSGAAIQMYKRSKA